jgi:hypothetical protein
MRLRLPDYWNGWSTLAMISVALWIAMLMLERRGVFRAFDAALMNTVSTEHGALRVLLILGLAVTVVGMSYMSFVVYRVHQMSERAEALTAATYLEAKRALEQHRS